MEDAALIQAASVPRGTTERKQTRKVRRLEVSRAEHLIISEPGDGIPIGTPAYVRYQDHVFYKDSEEIHQFPRVLEAVGKLSYLDEDFIRLTFEQYPDSTNRGESKVRSMGLVILKSNILEIRRAIDDGKS